MPVAAIGYTVICVIVGIAMIGFSIYQRSRLRESANWPQTMATITEARIVRETSQDSAEYHVHLSYDFVVDGRRYTGNRIEFNRHGYLRQRSAQEQLARFPLGSGVPAYFNPAKPGDAVLLRTAPFQKLYLIMGIAMLTLSAVIVVWSLARA